MTVRGQIISEDGPLDSASVTLVNSKGEYLGEGIKADRQGQFALTSTFLRDNYLLVTYAGMEPLMIDPDDYTGTAYKEILMFPKLLDEVIVTPGKNDISNLWWLLAIVGVSWMATKKGRKRTKRKTRNRAKAKT